jgi:hypothetical protein
MEEEKDVGGGGSGSQVELLSSAPDAGDYLGPELAGNLAGAITAPAVGHHDLVGEGHHLG